MARARWRRSNVVRRGTSTHEVCSGRIDTGSSQRRRYKDDATHKRGQFRPCSSPRRQLWQRAPAQEAKLTTRTAKPMVNEFSFSANVRGCRRHRVPRASKRFDDAEIRRHLDLEEVDDMRLSKLASVAFATCLIAAFAPRCGGDTTSNDDGGNPNNDGSVPPSDANPQNDSATGGDSAGPACTTDTSCAQPTPYCDTQIDQCVQCLSDTNCGNNRHCSASHTCVQCTSDANCGGQTPYCSPTGACVQCLSQTNCPTNDTCDTTNGYHCVPSCTSDAQCHAPLPKCDTQDGYCVQCLASTDCTNATTGHVCNTSTDRCVECAQDSDCATAQRPKCNTNVDICVQCLTNADCEAGTCGPQGFCN